MESIKRRGRMLGCAAAAAAVCGLVLMAQAAFGQAEGGTAPAPMPQESGGYVMVTANSKPSQERELTLPIRGTMAKVAVKLGDHVKAGDLLLQEDDRLESKELERLELLAASDVEIKQAEQEREVRRIALANVTKMREQNAANELEFLQAQAEHEIARLKVEQKTQEREQRTKEAEKQKVLLEMMRRYSPIDGTVSKLEIGEGEVADPARNVIAVVQNDPLWVEANVPTLVASRLKPGQQLEVRYPEEDQWQTATIEALSPKADIRSQTRLVRLTLPNPDQRESGLKMQLRIRGALAGAAQAAADRTEGANGQRPR